MLGGLIGFTSPWLLAGLAALPVIWWLLRLTPPAPARIAFPPARMLEGLRPPERTPERSPWWLTALRMLAATLVILALAGPLLNPNLVGLPSGRTVLLVIDNGWAAASRWSERQRLIAEVIQRAERDQKAVYIAPTAGLGAAWRPEPLTPEKARSLTQTLAPVPAPADHARLAQALRAGLDQAGGLNVVWLSDGIATPGRAALDEVLRNLAAGGEFRIAEDRADRAALALSGTLGADKKLAARIVNPGGAARQGRVHAISARGERLGEIPFAFSAGQTETTASFNLPLELQNQVARLEIAKEASAGAVYLLDARALRHRVGLLSSDPPTGSQPLLSPTHYIEKALNPFADVVSAPTGNLDEATEFLLQRKPSVVVMADIGRIVSPVEQRLRQWIENGGLLVRFAGERMERGADTLLPVRLREGGRTLGGALSWSTPQKLSPFETSSIFYGLAIPDDVTVSRQILADPAAIGPQSQIWARLTDGTPLVTATALGKGRIVLFHIPGTPEWSNLPISGVFVEMFRVMLEKTAPLSAVGADAGSEAGNAAGQRDAASAFLAPHLTLNGFGKLGSPPPQIRPQPLQGFDDIVPSGEVPPGYYGSAGDARALNILKPDAKLEAAPRVDAATLDYRQGASIVLAPWLYLAALAVFMVDAIVTALMMSGGRMRRAPVAASLAVWTSAGLLVMAFAQLAPAHAEPVANEPSPPQATIEGALQTRLAYVITGDNQLDSVSKAGLSGLSRVLAARTAMEPAEPMGVDVARDELSVFPLLYWAVPDTPTPLSDAVIAKIDAFMKSGGMIVFDTRDYQSPLRGLRDGSLDFGATPLGTLLAKLDVPRLEPVSPEHVVTKSFYILRGFPGRWDGGELWVEAHTNISDVQTRRALKSDGVSSILVTSNDLAAAWALDDDNRPLYPVVPGGEEQREIAFRAGVNIVMYALTGNYKADQVHVPALLERLGH